MRPILGIVLVVIGIVLVVLGISASESIVSSFSKFFTGKPSDRSIWLLLGGVVCLVVGASLGWRNSRT